MSDFGRRGLGRGLSALLGEPAEKAFAPAAATPPTFGLPAQAPAAPQPVEQQTTVHPFPSPAAPTMAELMAAAAPEPPPVAQAPAEGPGPRMIALDMIQRNPSQPRKVFEETELKSLADSIRAHGVLQPILVRPVRTSPGRYEIIAGERRWRAAQIAGFTDIPALVREAVAEVEVLEIAIIENVQRQDLNPIEEAGGYQALIEKFGRTQADIATIVGKSRPHVANTLRLLSAPAEIIEMVQEGRLSAGHARAILTAPDPLALARRAIAESLNVRDIERLAQAVKEAKEPKTAAEKDADLKGLEAKISEALGLAVTITSKGEGAGELKIAYKRPDQLDDLCRRLSR